MKRPDHTSPKQWHTDRLELFKAARKHIVTALTLVDLTSTQARGIASYTRLVKARNALAVSIMAEQDILDTLL